MFVEPYRIAADPIHDGFERPITERIPALKRFAFPRPIERVTFEIRIKLSDEDDHHHSAEHDDPGEDHHSVGNVDEPAEELRVIE